MEQNCNHLVQNDMQTVDKNSDKQVTNTVLPHQNCQLSSDC